VTAQFRGWSPLGMGALTGKFTRSRRSNDSRRGDILACRITEKGYAIIGLVEIAQKNDSSPAQTALAWRRHVDHHRGAHTVAARRQSRLAGGDTLARGHSRARRDLQTHPQFPGAAETHG
jgi:aryl-alcohol dehydrogenase-like predicted oxidoreductase